jgi:hypothetical protein
MFFGSAFSAAHHNTTQISNTQPSIGVNEQIFMGRQSKE